MGWKEVNGVWYIFFECQEQEIKTETWAPDVIWHLVSWSYFLFFLVPSNLRFNIIYDFPPGKSYYRCTEVLIEALSSDREDLRDNRNTSLCLGWGSRKGLWANCNRWSNRGHELCSTELYHAFTWFLHILSPFHSPSTMCTATPDLYVEQYKRRCKANSISPTLCSVAERSNGSGSESAVYSGDDKEIPWFRPWEEIAFARGWQEIIS